MRGVAFIDRGRGLGVRATPRRRAGRGRTLESRSGTRKEGPTGGARMAAAAGERRGGGGLGREEGTRPAGKKKGKRAGLRSWAENGISFFLFSKLT